MGSETACEEGVETASLGNRQHHTGTRWYGTLEEPPPDEHNHYKRQSSYWAILQKAISA